RKCADCIKISGNYYEAVIQARGEKSEKIMEIIRRLAPNRIITSVSRMPTGYDIKFTDKKKAAEIAQNLRQRFGVKRSYKLVGEKKGIKLYRNYYVVK
ncbi:MAG: NMD3-related protein, partial [Candidatus Aenigmarchaeota archaeon]|nr:NMD3-related protein [Candidatus Aenigmarchaeota archaeon]MDI6722279.1 NMD3-related protein [Candidatus Aenigmarchaeota archaeon]